MYRNCLYLLRCSSNVINQNKLENLLIKRWAGHSKWQNIKDVKQANDNIKSQYITKLNRRLEIAVRESGGNTDPEKNSKLKALIVDARANNIPKESVEKILKRLSGDKEGKPTYICVRGPKNLLFTLEISTSSLIKTRNAVVSIAKKFNFHVEVPRDDGTEFREKGVVKCKPLGDGKNVLDIALDHAIEVNAEEVREDEEKNLVFECPSHSVHTVRGKLEELGYNVDFADSVIKFSEEVELTDAEIDVCEKFLAKINQVSEVVKVSDNIM